MTDTLSRREFLKIAAIGAAAATLTGCGSAARYVVRQPYTDMPEYTLPGKSTYYATTCLECPAGCGLIVRTTEGRALKIEGNPNHPINRGRTCSRAQASLQGLYNPDRLDGPQMQAEPGKGSFGPIGWDTAISVVKETLEKTDPKGIAFLLGYAPHHVFDLASEIAASVGAPAPLRYSAYGMFDAQATLQQASRELLGASGLPHFDLASADMLFSFGADFAETWASPVAYQKAYSSFRRSRLGQRGYWVQFEPRLSLTASSADEWISLTPGTEGLVAAALGKLAAEKLGRETPAFAEIDISAAARLSGISEETIERLAGLFAEADHPLAIPGGAALGHTNGLASAKAILALNALAGNLGQPGGVIFHIAPQSGTGQAVSAFADVAALVERMNQGQVKALFIHGVNPVFELPKALGVEKALQKVPRVVSFSSNIDETSYRAHYLLPDHTPLESWGYHISSIGGDRGTFSSVQPVVAPMYNTKSTADVLLAASGLPYSDEVAYLQAAVSKLVERGAFFSASADAQLFWSEWLQHGGWWGIAADSTVKVEAALAQPLVVEAPQHSEGHYFLAVYPHPHLGDGAGANRPWLQETPDPTTTVMWNSWVAMHPKTAFALGVKDDDVVTITSPAGKLEASVYLYPGLRPDIVAIPFGQGHTHLGRYAQGRGANPLDVVALQVNAAGDLAFAATKVDISPTGKIRKLSRYEDQVGVYEQRKSWFAGPAHG
jgi:anaerobic selenocysteine-containing dehydrogenase